MVSAYILAVPGFASECSTDCSKLVLVVVRKGSLFFSSVLLLLSPPRSHIGRYISWRSALLLKIESSRTTRRRRRRRRRRRFSARASSSFALRTLRALTDSDWDCLRHFRRWLDLQMQTCKWYASQSLLGEKINKEYINAEKNIRFS